MPHDPATMALLFSIGHWIVGAFAFPISFLIAWQACRRHAKAPQMGLPLLLSGAGMTLAVFIVFHAGMDEAGRMLSWALSQPQQIQHFVFAALLVGIGVAEWAARRGGGAGLVWPFGYILLGAAFIVHEQIGDNAHAKWLYHVALGSAMMFAGALRLAQRRGWLDWRLGGLAFAVSIVVVGIMLVSYRENNSLDQALALSTLGVAADHFIEYS